MAAMKDNWMAELWGLLMVVLMVALMGVRMAELTAYCEVVKTAEQKVDRTV